MAVETVAAAPHAAAPHAAAPENGAAAMLQSRGENKKTGSKPSSRKNSESARVADVLPTAEELAEAAQIEVLDSDRQHHKFQDLIQASIPGGQTLVIFIRHFYCGMCQDFIRFLSTTVTPEYLSNLSRPTKIIVIGCGEPDVINNYVAQTSCPFPIYTEPDRQLYRAFGMVATQALGSKPEYASGSVLGATAKSIASALSQPSKALKGGNFSQVGGELLFRGTGPDCIFAHRMQTTRDHASVATIKEALGGESSPRSTTA